MKYFGKAVLPIKSMDRADWSSTSGPSPRWSFGVAGGVGRSAAPVLERLLAIQRFSNLSGNTLAQAALARFLATGAYEAHLRRVAPCLPGTHAGDAQGAADHLPPGVDGRSPGGYTLWVQVAEGRPARRRWSPPPAPGVAAGPAASSTPARGILLPGLDRQPKGRGDRRGLPAPRPRPPRRSRTDMLLTPKKGSSTARSAPGVWGAPRHQHPAGRPQGLLLRLPVLPVRLRTPRTCLPPTTSRRLPSSPRSRRRSRARAPGLADLLGQRRADPPPAVPRDGGRRHRPARPRRPSARTAILSNSTRVGDPAIRAALRRLDARIMKLDAGSQAVRTPSTSPSSPWQLASLWKAWTTSGRSPSRRSSRADRPATTPPHVTAWLALWLLRPVAVQVYTLDREAPTPV